VPGSKEHDDILKLMRQSRVFPEDNVPAVPIRMTSLYLPAREHVSTTPKPVSKKDMVVKPILKELEPIPEYEFVPYTPGMSKKQFMKIKITGNNIRNGDGRREEVQTAGASEGGAGEN
jgi:hypothetical protein